MEFGRYTARHPIAFKDVQERPLSRTKEQSPRNSRTIFRASFVAMTKIGRALDPEKRHWLFTCGSAEHMVEEYFDASIFVVLFI
jgi:hypothetical protein